MSSLEARSMYHSVIIIATAIIPLGCAMYSFYSFEEHGGELAGVEGSYWRGMEDEAG